MSKEDRSRLDKLERGLYSRKHIGQDPSERSEMHRPEVDVNKDWGGGSDTELERLLVESKLKEPSNLTKRIFIGSLVFFFISFAIAAFMFFGGGNSVSSNNIDISVAGPNSISAGDELSLEITVKNKNNTDLESASLLVEYPEGTREADNIETELLRQREDLGTIRSGKETRKTVKSVLFGEKDAIKEIKMTLEYRIKGSSAVFYKEKLYTVAIKSAPIIVTTELPQEINAGQKLDMAIEVASNSTETLKNVIVTAEYPFGFTFTSSEPKTADSDNIWNIGDLPSGEKKRIVIHGTAQGQNEEERTVRFLVGIAKTPGEVEIGAPLVALSNTFTIKKPYVDLAVSIGNDTGADYIARSDEKIQVNIVWTNNLPVRLLNAQINITLNGEALNKGSVNVANGGFYRSTANTITWNPNTNPELSDVGPGEKGVVSFSLIPGEPDPTNAGNKNITINAALEGNQVASEDFATNISSTVLKTIKLSTNLSLTARALHAVGPFENSGPLPPRAEEETSYTIIWDVTNTYNNTSGVKVSTTLPEYVSWANLTTPTEANIGYDSGNRTVTWNIGEVSAGTGYVSSPKEVSFQVVLEPSLTQVGSIPNLTSSIQISGQDNYTGRTVTTERAPLTTRLSNDPFFINGQETVVK